MRLQLDPTNEQKVNILLTNNTVISGSYVSGESANINALENLVNKSLISGATPISPDNFIDVQPNVISTYDDIINYFNTKTYFVTGMTTSKYESLSSSFIDLETLTSSEQIKMVGTYTGGTDNVSIITDTPSEYNILHKPIIIHGTDIVGMVLKIDKDNNIKEYILFLDTPFPIKYIDFGDNFTIFTYMRTKDIPNSNANISLYDGLVDEPKILSELFINRGANNAFEPVNRLKKVKTLNELTKIGLGYYKINTKGYNFKNNN